jgi:hypothetical protein
MSPGRRASTGAASEKQYLPRFFRLQGPSSVLPPPSLGSSAPARWPLGTPSSGRSAPEAGRGRPLPLRRTNDRAPGTGQADGPVRRARIAAAKRGKPSPLHVVAAIARGHRGTHPGAEARRKMSAAHRRRGTRPPKAGRPWTAAEDALVRTRRPKDAARLTGRTLTDDERGRLRRATPGAVHPHANVHHHRAPAGPRCPHLRANSDRRPLPRCPWGATARADPARRRQRPDRGGQPVVRSPWPRRGRLLTPGSGESPRRTPRSGGSGRRCRTNFLIPS